MIRCSPGNSSAGRSHSIKNWHPTRLTRNNHPVRQIRFKTSRESLKLDPILELTLEALCEKTPVVDTLQFFYLSTGGTMIGTFEIGSFNNLRAKFFQAFFPLPLCHRLEVESPWFLPLPIMATQPYRQWPDISGMNALGTIAAKRSGEAIAHSQVPLPPKL